MTYRYLTIYPPNIGNGICGAVVGLAEADSEDDLELDGVLEGDWLGVLETLADKDCDKLWEIDFDSDGLRLLEIDAEMLALGADGLAEIDALGAEGEAEAEPEGEPDKLCEIDFDSEADRLAEGDRLIELDSDGLGPLGEIDADWLLEGDCDKDPEALAEIEADFELDGDRLLDADSDGLGPEGDMEADGVLDGEADKLCEVELDGLRLADCDRLDDSDGDGAEGEAEIDEDADTDAASSIPAHM